MLAYAADRRRIVERRPSPPTLLLIAAAHIALIAAVMSARMDLPQRIHLPPIIVTPIRIPEPPPPDRPHPKPRPKMDPTTIDHSQPVVPLPHPIGPGIDSTPTPLPLPGGDTIGPKLDPLPTPTPVRVGPRFATPPSELRPPYPPPKLDREEEAVLRLKLTINAGGRVVAAEPVGKADPTFLAAARKHLIARWRYRPATEDGRAIASATVITLRFELNE